ncbi:HPr kinase/phosphorylase [Albimonas pacifica]|uniref:Hpr(Ser) kinase/phosphatase n=1 Tax=Albimonas pacifica TaxID=1114924 RepID=A0A1I3C381_9RHOB|nr:hypothetical protein [Albimonas pacifica]SFH69014.1 Hpr(Ser) kinase/phosphatase [Albimonas pacifica]
MSRLPPRAPDGAAPADLPLSPAAAAAAAARPDAQGIATLHASCVALTPEAEGGEAAAGFAAALILGPSGAGKSSLALELISRGARLVADDRCHLRAGPAGLAASAPAAIAGLIEARGVGLIPLHPLAEARVVAAVDLSRPEPERLPPLRRLRLLGVDLPLILQPSAPALFALLLAGGRRHAP